MQEMSWGEPEWFKKMMEESLEKGKTKAAEDNRYPKDAFVTFSTPPCGYFHEIYKNSWQTEEEYPQDIGAD